MTNATNIVTTPVSPTAPTVPSVGHLLCNINFILVGRCRLQGPVVTGRPLTIAFNSHDRPATEEIPPSRRRPEVYAAVVAQLQPARLTLRGTVHDQDMRWVLAIANWTSVHTLILRGYNSKVLNLALFNGMPNLHTLDIAHTELGGLSVDLSTANNNNNKLNSQAAADNTAASAAALQASHSTPPPLTFASSLGVLDANNNSLFQLPDNLLVGMTSLHTLNLTNNYVTAIPEPLFRDARSLETVWLPLNLMTSMAEGVFAGVSTLRRLNLDDNQLSTLPAGLFRDASRLELLSLSNNVIRTLPSTLFQHTQSLRTVHVFNSFLEHVHVDLFAHTPKMEQLNLFNGRLTAVPVGFLRNMPLLRYFSLSGNSLQGMPTNFFANNPAIVELYLNRNKLEHLPQDIFSPLQNLMTLGLGHNSLQHVPGSLLHQNTNLYLLALSFNRLTHLPASVLRNKPNLKFLYLSGNSLTRLNLDPSTDTLPNLSVFDVGENPIEALPPPSIMPNVSVYRVRSHRMPRIPMTPLLALRNLKQLEMPADPAMPPSVLAFTPEEADHDTAPESLVQVDLSNVVLSTAFLLFATQQEMALKELAVGWPGMNEDTAPVSVVCGVLASDVLYFGLHNTAYTRIDLCRGKRFDSVGLQNNGRLTDLTLLHNLDRLNISGCRQLQEMTLLSAQLLDISNTGLTFRVPLCDTWGTRVLLANHIRLDPTLPLADVGAHIQRCLSQVEVLDLSENRWLNQVSLVQTRPIVISDKNFWTDDFAVELTHNQNIPVFIINGGAVSCTMVLDKASARSQVVRNQVTSEVTFQFRCGCAPRFVRSGDTCVPDELSAGEIAAISLGVFILCAVILAYIYQHYRQRRRTLEVENKEVYDHLLQKTEEVLALKKVWEIDFEELRLMQRIDRDSEGAFGEVWLAKWDEMLVATKLLKRSVLMFDESQKQEFEKEVEFLQRTRHAHVVRFFGAGAKPDGTPFLVLEYVPLGSLQALLRQDLSRVLRQQASDALLSGKYLSGIPGSQGHVAVREAGEHVVVNAANSSLDGLALLARRTSAPPSSSSASRAAAAAASKGSKGAHAPKKRASVALAWSGRDGEQKKEEEEEAGDAAMHSMQDMQPTGVWMLKVRLAHDTACGMAFIHSLGHVHR